MSEPTREERIALNESRFREINDRVRHDLAQLRHAPEHLEFVCECAHLECRDQITLTVAEYERVRADPMRFAVVPGHEIPDIEDVVERTERFNVVLKRPEVAHVVTATDPRARGGRAGAPSRP
jgi:hypothetical protein